MVHPQDKTNTKHVGSYNDTNLLKIRPQQEFAITWSSDCSTPGSCEECTVLGHRPTRGMDRSRPNLNLLGFFDVHHADPQEPLQCGTLNSDYGFQNMVAFFYAIDHFNRNNNFGVQLGGLAIDTCSSDVRVSRDMFSLLMGQGLCETDGIASTMDPSSIIGVIPHGPSSSQTIPSMLAPRRVTMVSPTSGDDTLSGSPYFLSTIPPNAKKAEAIAAVARQMGWKYMTAVNSESAAYEAGMHAFFTAANAGGDGEVICMSKRLTLPEDATLEDARVLVSMLNRIQGSSVVALFTTPTHTRLLLEAVREAGLGDRFVFLNAEGSGVEARIPPSLKGVTNGAIILKVRSEVVQDFLDYVMSLTVARHGDIPDDWFAEFWQQALKCKLENSSMAQDHHARVCSPSDRLSPANVGQDDFALQTIIATYITAQGLLNADDCQQSPLGIAGCLREKGEIRRQLIFDGVQSSSWNVLQDELRDDLMFRFLAGGYGNTGFTVFSHQKVPGEDRYEYKQIGAWSDEGLKINIGDYGRSHSASDTRPPRSSCPPGTACSCVAFNGTVIGAGGSGSIEPTFSPVVGKDGSLHANLRSTWGIVVAALAALGILVTLCAFVYLLIFYPIKGGTSVLGYILLVAVLCMYMLVFAFLLNAVPETCAVRRFCLGLVYALAFSCMLVKVLNTWRLGAYFTQYLPSYQRLAHPCSLVFIVLSLTLVQVIIGTEWLILKPPNVENIIYEGSVMPRCAPADLHNEELVLSFVYVLVLMLLTLIFSAVTWDSEENHRESRWLLITTSFTIGITVVWMLVSMKTEIRYREPAIAIALIVNATIILLAIFVRKIYLLNKYQKEADDERKSQFAINADETKDHDFYSTLYNNQAFDNSGEAGSRKGVGSHAGSGVVYMYDGTTGNHQGVGQNMY